MLRKCLFAGSLLLTVCSLQASQPDFYTGVSLGYGSYDTSQTPSNVHKDTTYLNYGLFGGALWSHDNMQFGPELSVNQFGKKTWTITAKEFTLQSKTIGLNGVFRYHLPALQSLFFETQAGGVYIWQDTQAIEKLVHPVLPTPIGSNESGLKPDVGLGIGYTFFKNWTVGINYTKIFASQVSAPVKNDAAHSIATQSEFNKIASIDNFTFRLVYTF